MSLTKKSKTDLMRVAQGPDVLYWALSSLPCPHTGSLKPDYELDLPSKIFSYKLDTCLLGLLSTSSSDSLYRISGYVTEEQDL